MLPSHLEFFFLSLSCTYASFPAYLKKNVRTILSNFNVPIFTYTEICLCVYVCVCVCGLTIYTAQIDPFCHFLYDVKKQTILCTQGANLSPKTKCNFGKASGMCSTLRELGITGLVCHPVVKVQAEVHSKVHNIEKGNNKPQHREIRIKYICP